uniref:Uncharacterized protein n=1 Tax=Strongyloides venezuelensis TaxID=75913 RepID=A0A0K0F6D1_STRVS
MVEHIQIFMIMISSHLTYAIFHEPIDFQFKNNMENYNIFKNNNLITSNTITLDITSIIKKSLMNKFKLELTQLFILVLIVFIKKLLQ